MTENEGNTAYIGIYTATELENKIVQIAKHLYKITNKGLKRVPKIKEKLLKK